MTTTDVSGLSPERQAALARLLAQRRAAETAGIRPRPRDGGMLPCSFEQRRMWLAAQVDPDGVANVTAGLSLRGALDADALRAAVGDLVRRHEILRTAIVDVEGEPYQRIAPEIEPPVELVDLSHLPAAAREDRARDLARLAAGERFDLARAPLFRVHLYRLAPEEHRLLFVWHHINADGWSVDNAIGEIAAAYQAHRDGTPLDLPPLPVQYADYAAWSRERMTGDVRRGRLDYWKDRLSADPTELRTGEPGPARTAEVVATVPASLAEAVRSAGGPRTTPYAAFLTAYKVLLMRLTGERDVTVGSVTGGRGRTELEPLIGCFINLLPLRTGLGRELTFREAVARVRATLGGALQHELPFDELVSGLSAGRGGRSGSLFQSAVIHQQAHAEHPDWRGPAVERWGRPLDEAAFDLALIVRELPGEFELCFRFRGDRFAAEAVEDLAARFETLLRSIEAAPLARLGDHELLGPGEHDRVVREWNATGAVRPPWTGLHRIIEPHVRDTPDAPAVAFGERTLSYAELDRGATRLARRLRGLGAGRDVPIGVCLDQSVQTAIAVFGVLKAGAPYLPLDPELPASRLEYMLSDAGAPVVITTPGLAPGLTGCGARIVLIGEDGLPVEDLPEKPLDDGAGPDDLAYVIYTSGSTGTPKGVAVQHRQIVNYLEGVRQRFGIRPGSAFGLLQSLTFDFGITTFYLALATGGRLHMIPKRSSGAELAAAMADAGIDYLKMTPSHLAALADEVGAEALLPRRALIVGGEASRTAWLRELAGYGRCEVFNHYGPTEATVGLTTWRVTADGPAGTLAPIGGPLPGARAYVLDEDLHPVPPGVTGEIFLGGDRLARCYLGRPELTAERFVADPFGAPGDRLYRTGDLGRYLPDGNLEFLGRRDHQVKIRGYRVELGEVEAALATCPGVVQAVATVRNDRLIAYLEGTARLPAGDLRARLAGRLPDYMVPSRFVWLERFPLQAHGKVDRKRLPEPVDDRSDQVTAFVQPEGPIERVVAQVWADVLGIERIGALDDFFDLGGHSLLATQVVARLRRALPPGARPVSVVELFDEPTVRGVARLAAGPDAERPLLHELTRTGSAEVSYVCVPYGGANAVVFQPLADALPEGHALYSVAVPGHDVAVEEETRPLEEVAERCAAEILERIRGPLVVYGHCGPGGALAIEIARRVEAAGRRIDAVYLGGVFPFARPRGRVLGPLFRALRIERLRSDTVYANWLQAIGADLAEADAEQRRFLVRAMRADAEQAEEYFTGLLDRGVPPLAAPVISVVGERDPGTEFYRERYREWGFLTGTTALVVIDEAGHYFLKYRAAELAEIVTTVHRDLSAPGRGPDATWWLQAVDDTASAGPAVSSGTPDEVRPSMGRFLGVAAGQMVSMIGTALTEYAIPMWTYLESGSLLRFTVFALVALVPGLLAAPLLGALVDRTDRRRALLASGLVAGGVQGVLLVVLASTGGLPAIPLYALLCVLSVALTAQRLAYGSAVPQLIPKQYMGHANGVVQFTMGVARFLVPVVAVGMMATVGLSAILTIDVVSYVAAVGVLALVRFPDTLPWRPREGLAAEVRYGFHYLWRRPGLRAMVVYFFVLNIFLAAVFVLISPLALSAGTLSDAGWIAMIAGIGATAGGALMALWGGPRLRRMRGMLLFALLFAGCCTVAGLRPALPVIAAGVFGMCLTMAVVDGIWMTVIHTKVPHRFHARVIAVNQMLAMSTQPLGLVLVAPLAPALFNPLLEPDGPLAGTVGGLLGTGEGRGIGLLYVLCGLGMALWTAAALRHPLLAHFDRDTPDAEPDDLVGLRTIQKRTTS
ncbi:amino acid adenylation domain-containing protein [Actinomadura sp.]|uniref:amino acid adenylation domain-containing protein n=1 Tax=Actinomadura sp. TaxID=1989 RepID=UPI0037C98C04